jgi:hypothetical protein
MSIRFTGMTGTHICTCDAVRRSRDSERTIRMFPCHLSCRACVCRGRDRRPAPERAAVKHHRIFGIFPSPAKDITEMPDFMGYHPRGDLKYVKEAGEFYGNRVCEGIANLPPGKRVMQARWIMRYETYCEEPYNADPVAVIENGGYDVSVAKRMMRPLGRMLRERKLFLDGIFVNSEGSFTFFDVTPDQMKAVFASSKARANMPPALRNARPEQVTWWTPEFNRNLGITWNRWQQTLLYKAFRQIFIQSNFFKVPRKVGPAVNPVVVNFNWASPTWEVMDPNGWPIRSVAAIDYQSSCPGLYFDFGNRYKLRNHHPFWNIMVDHINMARSCLNKSDARFWPTTLQPLRVHPWLFEKTLEHIVKTGATWTSTRSAWIYFAEQEWLRAQSDPLFVEILDKFDKPYPRQMGLPRLEIDCDRIETPGVTTTYEEFLDNVDISQYPFTMDTGDPFRIHANEPRLAVA